jgi:putative transposase
MARRYDRRCELATEDWGFEKDELVGNDLDFYAREGARLILTVMLHEEVETFLGRGRYERKPGSRQGSRNGSRERPFQCGSGTVEVPVPRVRDTEEPFRPATVSGWRKKSAALLSVIPQLYIEGLSTRDFRRALRPLLGETGLSRSTVSRITQELKGDFAAWRRRSLADEDIVYLFLDGFYLGVRRGRSEKDAILVAHGVRRDGNRVLLSVMYGGRESADGWKGVLHDLLDRGLKPPALAVSDGNPGLIRALKDVLSDVPRQRCTKHRTSNVLLRVPRKRQTEVKQALAAIFHAADLDEALKAAERFSTRYRDEFPEACQVLGTDLADCLTFFRFPPRHWKRIRTSNVIERAFREVRRRTDVVGRFPTSMSAMLVVWSVIDHDRIKWRGLHMDAEQERRIGEAVIELEKKPIEVRGFEWLAAA